MINICPVDTKILVNIKTFICLKVRKLIVTFLFKKYMLIKKYVDKIFFGKRKNKRISHLIRKTKVEKLGNHVFKTLRKYPRLVP